MGFYQLPKWLKRDLKRIYRPYEVVQTVIPPADLICLVGTILASGKTAIVEGFSWRSAMGGFGARRVEKMFVDKLSCGSEYRRRGDLLIFFRSA